MSVTFSSFLRSVASSGEVEVESGPEIPPVSAEAQDVLRQLYVDDAWHFPARQPAYDEEVALRMARWFYAACMCYADRSMSQQDTAALLQPVILPQTTPAQHYSADLVLRHLPGLFALARGLADDDPVVTALAVMGWRWPLSAPGVPLPPDSLPPDLSAILGHPGLRRVYLDRIFREKDRLRLRQHPFLAGLARDDLGLHFSLSPFLLSETLS